MHVVRHQHIGMQGNAMLGESIDQAMTVIGEIFIIQECGGTVDATMGDMKRNPWQFEPWATWHGDS